MLYNNDTFEHKGRTFRLEITRDDAMGEPWKEHDGHGIVSERKRHPFGHGTKPPKRAGERVLYWESGTYRTYDVAETMKIAKRDGWGLSPKDEAELAQKLGRQPTRNEIIAAAVDRDFEYLRAWCNDEWRFVVIGVHHDDESEYLGGVEDSDSEYVEETARELADEICARLDCTMRKGMFAERPDMYT
jgi:hypothetical protein